MRRAYLGVGVASRPPRDGRGGGAGVESIAPNSPVERAGVRPGDVIVGFDEKPVRGTDELLSLLDEFAIGRDVEIQVLRGDRRLSFKVRPREQPAE